MNLRSASGTMVVGTAALLLIAVLGWFLLIGPTTSNISETHDSTDAAVTSNQMLSSQVAALQHQADELPAMRKVSDELEAVFPATADQPGFFAAINKAAGDAGIPADKVTTLSPTAPVLLDSTGAPATPATQTADTSGTNKSDTAADLAEQTVAVTVEGSYEKIRKLLSNLEAMPRAFIVSSLGITAGDGTTSTNPSTSTLTVSITGSTFVAPPIAYPELKNGGSPKSTG